MANSNFLTLAIVLVNGFTITQLCCASLPPDLQNRLKDTQNDPNMSLSDFLAHQPPSNQPLNNNPVPPSGSPVSNPIAPTVNKSVNLPTNNLVNPPVSHSTTPAINNSITPTVNNSVTSPPKNPNPVNPPVSRPVTPPNNKPVTQLINSPVILQEDPNEFLIPQNAARAKVGVPPFVWNESLAEFARSYAQERANDCKLQHSHSPGKGENIARAPYILSPAKAVEMWVSEESNYDIGSNSCKKVCGHYTQVVWRDTTSIGCARSNCQNRGTFVTCNYYPPGNVGRRKPY